MPELWDQLMQVPAQPQRQLYAAPQYASQYAANSPTGPGIDPFNPPQVEYVGRPIAEGLAKLFSGPSWLERATEQSGKDQAAFQAGGVPGLMADTSVGQDLAGGFGGTTKGIRAYHGSPHDFNKFDLSKIGTGEGAQAYGHGLYFAENEGVARQYRNALEGKHHIAANDANAWALGLLKAHGDDPARAIADIRGRLAKAEDADSLAHSPQMAGKLRDAIGIIEGGGVQRGKMYEVNINADPAHMLDWDKPLAQQSSTVQNIASDVLKNPGRGGGFVADADRFPVTGQSLYQAIGARERGPISGPHWAQSSFATKPDSNLATDALREAGIPGIKYLDQGSRNVTPLIGGHDPTHLQRIVGTEYPRFWSGKQSVDDAITQAREMGRTPHVNELMKMKEAGVTHPQTSNYVMFNDKLIDIIRKYGLAGMLGGGALAPGLFGEEQQQ